MTTETPTPEPDNPIEPAGTADPQKPGGDALSKSAGKAAEAAATAALGTVGGKVVGKAVGKVAANKNVRNTVIVAAVALIIVAVTIVGGIVATVIGAVSAIAGSDAEAQQAQNGICGPNGTIAVANATWTGDTPAGINPDVIGKPGGIPAKAMPWIEAGAKASERGIPAAFFAAMMNRETSFNENTGFTPDSNGGTMGVLQMNQTLWKKWYDPAGFAADKNNNGRKDIEEPLIMAAAGAKYLDARLDGVIKLKKANPTKPFAQLPDLLALAVAHNGGEGGLMRWPNSASITRDYSEEMQKNMRAWSAPVAANTATGTATPTATATPTVAPAANILRATMRPAVAYNTSRSQPIAAHAPATVAMPDTWQSTTSISADPVAPGNLAPAQQVFNYFFMSGWSSEKTAAVMSGLSKTGGAELSPTRNKSTYGIGGWTVRTSGGKISDDAGVVAYLESRGFTNAELTSGILTPTRTDELRLAQAAYIQTRSGISKKLDGMNLTQMVRVTGGQLSVAKTYITLYAEAALTVSNRADVYERQQEQRFAADAAARQAAASAKATPTTKAPTPTMNGTPTLEGPPPRTPETTSPETVLADQIGSVAESVVTETGVVTAQCADGAAGVNALSGYTTAQPLDPKYIMPGVPAGSPPITVPNGPGTVVVAAAQQFLGTRYSFGGGGAQGPGMGNLTKNGSSRGVGLDCSGLSSVAIFQASKSTITLPRVAADQFAKAGTSIAKGQEQAGDLVFFRNSSGRVYHVGIVAVPGKYMINAPTFGATVRYDDYATSAWWWAKDLAGFKRVVQQEQQAPVGSVANIAAMGTKGEWGLALPLKKYVVSSEFNPARVHPISGTVRAHQGIDLASGCGNPVYASRAGTITKRDVWGGGGNTIAIDHGTVNGVQLLTRYLHLKDFSVSPPVGTQVAAGQLIALEGNTGGSTGCHLHFQTEINGLPRNPRDYVNF